MAPGTGFEPATNWLTANCSTTELPRNIYIYQVIISVEAILVNIKQID